MRDFWRGEPRTLAEFASRLTGSSDLYQDDGRRPLASINFVTAHDGFTLRDLVSYNEKHNEANGEDNRDGESHNRSWNCGVEGPTDDPAGPRAARPAAAQLPRHAAALAGRADDRRTATSSAAPSSGNNNAYCQDNEIAWVDWDLDRGRQKRPARVHPRGGRGCAATIRCSAGAASSTGDAVTAPTSELGDIAWFTPGRAPR